jgi:hypothetical protein
VTQRADVRSTRHRTAGRAEVRSWPVHPASVRTGPPGRSRRQLLQGQELGGVHVDQLRRSSILAGEQLVGERRSDSIEPRLAWACTPPERHAGPPQQARTGVVELTEGRPPREQVRARNVLGDAPRRRRPLAPKHRGAGPLRKRHRAGVWCYPRQPVFTRIMGRGSARTRWMRIAESARIRQVAAQHRSPAMGELTPAARASFCASGPRPSPTGRRTLPSLPLASPVVRRSAMLYRTETRRSGSPADRLKRPKGRPATSGTGRPCRGSQP